MKPTTLPVLTAAQRAHKQGDLKTAEHLYRQVLTADPASAAAARGLGTILCDSGRHREAIPILGPASQRHPHDAALLACLGRCCFATGQLKAAAGALERAVNLDPGSRIARVWLADCRMAAFRPADALALLAPVLAARPVEPLALTIAARALIVGGRFDEAIEHLRGALALNASEPLRATLAWALKRAGRLDEALVEFDAALARSPASDSLIAGLIAGKAETLDALGDREGARQVLQPAIERGPITPDLALAYARVSKSKQHRAAAIDAAEKALAAMPPAAAQYEPLTLALGALLDGAGEYDRAFECFRRGNESSGIAFDPAGYRRSVQRTLDTFSAANLPGIARATNSDELPIFIVGMPRSGTSLVEQILASHPKVHGAGELYDLSHLAADMQAGSLHHKPEQLEVLAQRYLGRLRELGPGAKRVTDKMPHNFQLLGLVDVLFPGARIVHCVRNPLDTCLSCYMTELSQQHSFKRRLPDLAFAYKEYRRMMEHWKGVLRTPIMDARYEDLIADTEPNVRRLLEFVGLGFDERCTRPHENTRVVNTASIDQVRRPIYDSSVNRWKNYERHLGPLIEGLRGQGVE